MVFIETSTFSRIIRSLLSDDEYRKLQIALLEHPALGDLIRGGAGLRKLRWARKGKGKSGGIRTIYYWAVAQDRILMVYAYPKNEMADLTKKQLAELAKVAKKEFEHG